MRRLQGSGRVQHRSGLLSVREMLLRSDEAQSLVCFLPFLFCSVDVVKMLRMGVRCSDCTKPNKFLA